METRDPPDPARLRSEIQRVLNEIDDADKRWKAGIGTQDMEFKGGVRAVTYLEYLEIMADNCVARGLPHIAADYYRRAERTRNEQLGGKEKTQDAGRVGIAHRFRLACNAIAHRLRIS